MRRSACIGLLLLVFATSIDATTIAPLTFEQLVTQSAAVVYGRVTAVRAQWTADRRFIESIVSIEVMKGLKGSAHDTVQFSVPGGQVGRYRNVIPGAPVFTEGDVAVVFLTAHGARMPVTTGLTQGVFRVHRDARTGEMLVMPPAPGTGRMVRGDVARKPAPLPDFEASVRAIAGPR